MSRHSRCVVFTIGTLTMVWSVARTALSVAARKQNVPPRATLACLMLVRDEEENISKNLNLWGKNFFDAFVVAVDDRTIDRSREVLGSTIPQDKPRLIYNFSFHDFGTARTELLRHAHKRFSNVSHVMMVDPDWRPVAGSLNKQDLLRGADAYQFTVHDRSGASTRQVNWLGRNQPNLTFAYYIHEDFRLPNGYPPFQPKELDWIVHEVEPDVSWHNHVGHGNSSNASRSHERHHFDVDMLNFEQSSAEYRDSAHTLFYLGLTHSALLEGSDGFKSPFVYRDFKLTKSMQHHLDRHIEYFERFVHFHLDSVFSEYVYLSLRWLAYGYQFLLLREDRALPLYHQCISYDPTRVDCQIELSKLLTYQGDHIASWFWAKRALLTEKSKKAWTHTYMYDCVTPLQVARAAANRMSIDYYSGYDPHRFALGRHLLAKAVKNCKTIILEPDDILEQLVGSYDFLYRVNNKGLAYNTPECLRERPPVYHEDVPALAYMGQDLYCE